MDAATFFGLERTDDPARWRMPVVAGLTSGRGSLFGGCALGAAIEVMEQLTARPCVWATAQYLNYATVPDVLELDALEVVRGHRLSQARVIAHVGDTEILTVLGAFGGRPFTGEGQWATRPEERSKLWEARHNAYFACLQLKPGSRAISTDVCVPISRLAECVVETTKDIEKASMPIPLFGHVGDGNFHLVILIDPNSKADMEEAKALNLRVVKRALAMEGTCTGEHGVGLGKQPYLLEELGEAVDLMRDLKRTFDPENLLNPGKVVSL